MDKRFTNKSILLVAISLRTSKLVLLLTADEMFLMKTVFIVVTYQNDQDAKV